MDNPGAAADAIVRGLSGMLSKLIEGESLESVIGEATGRKYTTISSFQNGFASDTGALGFISETVEVYF